MEKPTTASASDTIGVLLLADNEVIGLDRGTNRRLWRIIQGA
jgi:hypothetical protein